MSSPYFHRLQRRHFILYDILPFLGTLLALALAFTGVHPPTRADLAVFAVMWCTTGFAISIGFHRMFCHRAFKAHDALRATLLIVGSMAARSSVTTWVAQHRRHHELADHPGDAHSPNLHGPSLAGRAYGLLYSFVLWMWKHEYPNVVRYARDLMNDPLVSKLDRRYSQWTLLGFVLPGVVGGLLSQSFAGVLTGALWGGAVRMCVVSQQISAVNCLNHVFGTRPFRMPDNSSRNIPLFALTTWGEGWHNNHHAFPTAANFGFRWYQPDPSAMVIRVLEWVGLAWDVSRPAASKVEALRQKLATAPTRALAGEATVACEGSRG